MSASTRSARCRVRTSRSPNKPAWNDHPLRIQQGSLLHRVLGRSDCRVNTSHHQAIKQPAPSLNASVPFTLTRYLTQALCPISEEVAANLASHGIPEHRIHIVRNLVSGIKHSLKTSQVTVKEGFGTILLVDDEAIVLNVTAAMLRRLGYTVLTTLSGREAVEIYTEHADRISAVVLDMIMPEMGGGEVFDQLKRINPHVKVLLASGYSMQGQARDILNRGCNGFLQKPFTLEDISVRLRSLIGRR